jgi:hypothetical protein
MRSPPKSGFGGWATCIADTTATEREVALKILPECSQPSAIFLSVSAMNTEMLRYAKGLQPR